MQIKNEDDTGEEKNRNSGKPERVGKRDY